MKVYENNMADQALVVRSLKVLDKIDGGGIKEIRNDVNAVKKQLTIQNRIQEEYWSSLSADGVISSVEKQVLKREMAGISRSYSAILTQAEVYDPTNPWLASFTQTYNDLYLYIYTTLKLFDDMEEDTAIPDRALFNQKFGNYYWLENIIQIAISAGILDQINFRVLTSLNEPGEENETGIYKGGLYQYTNGAWKSVTTGAYKGPQHELPGTEEGAFFISDETFSMVDVLIVNGDELYINGEPLEVLHNYTKGLIYYCEEGIWRVEDDLTNWRYAAAFADVINITGRLPQIFQDAIDDLQEQVDGKANASSLQEEIEARQGQYTIIAGDIVEINDDITGILSRVSAAESDIEDQQTQINGKVSHLPVYFGPTATAPASPQEGDYYLYTGSDANKSKIRRYRNGAWEWLDPLNSSYNSYYMTALEDVLACNVTSNGYFAAVFCNSFWANEATMNKLSTKTIFIRQGGYIQSDKVVYTTEEAGMQINASGDIDANGDVHLCGNGAGKKVAIGVSLKNDNDQYQSDFNTYDVVIGGKTLVKSGVKIQGDLDGATGSFSGELNGASGSFGGFLNCSPLYVDRAEIRNYLLKYTGEVAIATLCQDLKNLGFLIDGTRRSVSQVLASYSNVLMAFPLSKGEYNISNIKITDVTKPYRHKEIDFNDGNYIITEDEGGSVTNIQLYCLYSLGTKGRMRLSDIPQLLPTEQNIVWRDGNGYLRIS